MSLSGQFFADDVISRNEGLVGIRSRKAGQQFESRALARAVWSDEQRDFARLRGEGHVTEHVFGTIMDARVGSDG